MAKKYDFKVEVITFDGEVLYEYGKDGKSC